MQFFFCFYHFVHACDVFCRYFTTDIDLAGLQIDVALRLFQTYFRMPVSEKTKSMDWLYNVHRLCGMVYVTDVLLMNPLTSLLDVVTP